MSKPTAATPIKSATDAETRPGDPLELTAEKVRELIPWTRQISEGGLRRLKVELLPQNLQAVHGFERSCSSLTRWLVALSIVLATLTAAIARYTVLLARFAQTAGH